jgi:hypothetical protein
MTREEDEAREERISWEAIPDAHDAEERAMGWYSYLDDKVTGPFKARCRSARRTSPLRAGEDVEVRGMAPEDDCETEMFVWIDRGGKQLAVPLAQLEPLSKDPETNEAVGDWLYWVDRGNKL